MKTLSKSLWKEDFAPQIIKDALLHVHGKDFAGFYDAVVADTVAKPPRDRHELALKFIASITFHGKQTKNKHFKKAFATAVDNILSGAEDEVFDGYQGIVIH